MQRTFSPLMGQGMVDLEGTVKEPSDDEEDEDIDQFNDDTFGPGALDEDWEAAHEKLAGLRLSAGGHCMFNLGIGDEGDELGEAELEESLSKLVLEEDLEDTAVVASKKQPVIEIPLSVHSIWGTPPDIGPFSLLPLQFEDEAIVRAGKAMSADEVQQSLLNRAPPPRSTSPVFGSPPVHTAPIGTPPKYPPHPQQILRPIPTHLRPHLHQTRFHGAFNGRLSPSHSQSPGICGPPGPRIHGFPSMQRASLLHHQSQAGRLSPSQFSCLPTVLPSPLNPLSPLPHKLLPGCRPHLIHPYVRPPHFMSPPAMHVLRGFPRPVHPSDLHPQHRRLLNLQQQRGKSQQNGVATGCHPPGTGCPSSFDPYANLMTQREKEWVVRIQMLQLQSGGSGVNDYYYKMYFERLERRALAGDTTSGGISKKREPLRLITPQVALAEHTYTPMQFHGSLGKLTVSSVNNPRKMIDTGPLARSDDEELKDKQGRDKRRRVLQAIEQAYSLLLQLEDLECLLSRSTPAERDEVALRHDSCQRQLFNMPCKSCTPADEDEKRAWEEGFVTMMTVRKGRRLIGRMLPFLLASQQAAIVMATANHITHVVRKDSADEVLLPFLPAFSLALGAQSLPTLTTVLEILTRGTASSLCLTNRFTAGFVYALVTCGERKLDGSISYVPIEARQRWLDVLGTISGELNRTLGVGGEQLATTPLPPAVLAAFRRVRTPFVNPTLVSGPLS